MSEAGLHAEDPKFPPMLTMAYLVLASDGLLFSSQLDAQVADDKAKAIGGLVAIIPVVADYRHKIKKAQTGE